VRTAFAQAVETFRALGYPTRDIEAPLAFPALDLKQVVADRQNISRSLFQGIDVLLLPTTTDVTPGIEEARAAGPQAVSADNTVFCNYYGLPAISIPCGFSTNGLPFGLQIVGPRWGEGTVLHAAHRFQQATHWHAKHPMLS
jgi:aspartyl-tRNA(Asn)/glutamyl-tRNA(Gln) amidotransferase subunit A